MQRDHEQVCSRCGSPWRGTQTSTRWTELDRQDHKGPTTIYVAACCGREAATQVVHSDFHFRYARPVHRAESGELT